MSDEILIYEGEGKSIDVRLDAAQETLWLTQKQMAEVFSTTPENILMHLRNIHQDHELDEAATTKDFLVVQTEGSRQVKRKLKHSNLDAIISVGYRVNSKRAVQFRQWATEAPKGAFGTGVHVESTAFKSTSVTINKARANPKSISEKCN